MPHDDRHVGARQPSGPAPNALHATDADNARASCGGGGASDIAVRFVAPVAGRWSFSLEATAVATRQFALLPIRTDCADPDTERICASALRGPGQRQAGGG